MCNVNEKCGKGDKGFESDCSLCDRKIYARLHDIHADLDHLAKFTDHGHKMWRESEELRLKQLMADNSFKAAQNKENVKNIAANILFSNAQLSDKLQSIHANATFEGKQLTERISRKNTNLRLAASQIAAKSARHTSEFLELKTFKEKVAGCNKMHWNMHKIQCKLCKKYECMCSVNVKTNVKVDMIKIPVLTPMSKITADKILMHGSDHVSL